MDAIKAPKTLQQAVVLFSNPDAALTYAIKLRWPDGLTCPRCGSEKHSFISTRRIWFCKGCKKQFTVKVGTIFEDSPIDIGKWMIAYWMLLNCKNGISSYEVAKTLGVTQKSAWFMLHRLRLAMQDTKRGGGKLSGGVEVDETFIGGKSRNMHRADRARKIHGTGGLGKTVVVGLLQRGGNVRTAVVKDRDGATLRPIVRANVEPGAAIFTDENKAYGGLAADFEHGIINHAVKYVDGIIHTNGMENFWSLLKRGLGGTYVSVEPFHLFRYVDEQAFRFNYRHDQRKRDSYGRPVKRTDADRFELGMSQVSGKRLTFKELTGKEGNQRADAF